MSIGTETWTRVSIFSLSPTFSVILKTFEVSVSLMKGKYSRQILTGSWLSLQLVYIGTFPTNLAKTKGGQGLRPAELTRNTRYVNNMDNGQVQFYFRAKQKTWCDSLSIPIRSLIQKASYSPLDNLQKDDRKKFKICQNKGHPITNHHYFVFTSDDGK